ncbi:heme biosynthesis protein HemY [Poseidonocella sedimentorum]|uniref:HemY protein n=1 Tax=Poseidonocella sedimentorum TaxID=871652 RepID=A0A1I6D949_9RHOB|nr:heme biosynthesis HemY N-terminal domain-containing protein [Poseidonocella sedimentorum]SFR01928.1 HemY protein [Poseidonocella sedimentorum]
MLWSLVKIVVFLALVVALTLGSVFLLESEGGVQVTVAGTEFTLGPLQSVIALVLLLLVVFVLLKLAGLLVAVLKFINGDETAITRYFDRNRERKGLLALTEGLVALASGDGKEAMAKAARADKMLNQPNLGRLITAQAAEIAGDRKTAESAYKALLVDEKTRFVGIRGIMRQRLEAGDTDTALKLAERAFALKPKHGEIQDTLLQLQARKQDWSGARDTLKAKARQGQIPRDVHKRRDAVLALGQAKGVLAEGADIEAREKAIEANRLSPDLVPAAVLAARGYIEQGSHRHAARVLKKAWSVRPHPDLAAAFAEIEPGETPEARIKRFRALIKPQPDHPESRMLMAELNIAAENFPEARRALGDLVETAPDARVLTIMAAIARGEGADDAMVKGWLARALSAPRGPQWVCENCKTAHAEWAPVCSVCEGFDTMSWTTPPSPDVSSATGVGMLPLIVGQSAKPAAPEDDADVVEAEAERVETEEAAAPKPAG